MACIASIAVLFQLNSIKETKMDYAGIGVKTVVEFFRTSQKQSLNTPKSPSGSGSMHYTKRAKIRNKFSGTGR